MIVLSVKRFEIHVLTLGRNIVDGGRTFPHSIGVVFETQSAAIFGLRTGAVTYETKMTKRLLQYIDPNLHTQ